MLVSGFYSLRRYYIATQDRIVTCLCRDVRCAVDVDCPSTGGYGLDTFE
jgi:hypothetical protein